MYLIFDPFLLCLPMGLTTDEKPTADHKVGQHTHTYIHIHTHTYIHTHTHTHTTPSPACDFGSGARHMGCHLKPFYLHNADEEHAADHEECAEELRPRLALTRRAVHLEAFR